MMHMLDSYVLKFLEKWQMDQASPKDTPLPTSLTPDPEEKTLDQKDRHYNGLNRDIVGGLIWLSTRTRPDLAFAVHSRYCHVAHKKTFQPPETHSGLPQGHRGLRPRLP